MSQLCRSRWLVAWGVVLGCSGLAGISVLAVPPAGRPSASPGDTGAGPGNGAGNGPSTGTPSAADIDSPGGAADAAARQATVPPATTREASGGVTAPSQLGSPLPLGRRFERTGAGISLQFPDAFKPIAVIGGDELIRFVDDEKKPDWTLSVSRRSFPTPQNLFSVQAPGKQPTPGIIENTLAELKKQFPACKVLRAGDPTNIGKSKVGVIIARYTLNGERRLAQNAIIEANDQLFFLVSLTTPGRRDVKEDLNAEETTVDPVENSAVVTFRNILDTVLLQDLGVIRTDQTERLYRTRALFRELDTKRVMAGIVPERYQRILRQGVDVGYTYIVEKPERVSKDGVRVGIRTRLMTKTLNGKALPVPREDSEAIMYSSVDRSIETWTRMTVFDTDGRPHDEKNPWKKVSEIGSSQLDERRVLVFNPNDPGKDMLRGENGDPHQPWTRTEQRHPLKVELRSGRSELPPVERNVGPWYLPGAIDEMLPHLLAGGDAKSYMFAVYVSGQQEVMSKYIDVGAQTPELPELVRKSSGLSSAVPVVERIGFDGPKTIRWFTKDGQFIGGESPSEKLVYLPTTLAELNQIWKCEGHDALFALPADAIAGSPTTQPQNDPAASLRNRLESTRNSRTGRSERQPAPPPDNGTGGSSLPKRLP